MSERGELERHIADHVSVGCHHVSLGIRDMPDGYALMLDPDRMYYYWLRHDGDDGAIHWSKWACYEMAKADALMLERSAATSEAKS